MLGVLGQIDRPHRTLAESPNDPVTAELAGKAAPLPLRLDGSLPDRLRHDGFLAMRGKRLGGVARRSGGVSASAGFRTSSSAAMAIAAGRRSVRAVRGILAVDRLAAINPLRDRSPSASFNPRVFRLGPLRFIVQTPTPDIGCPQPRVAQIVPRISKGWRPQGVIIWQTLLEFQKLTRVGPDAALGAGVENGMENGAGSILAGEAFSIRPL